jgi:hypothetical protein
MSKMSDIHEILINHAMNVKLCERIATETFNAAKGIDAKVSYSRDVVRSKCFIPSFDIKQDFLHQLTATVQQKKYKNTLRLP